MKHALRMARAGVVARGRGGGAGSDPFEIGIPTAFDYDASTLELADGASVTEWSDQSGNGRDLAPLGTAPTFNATEGAVAFDGTDRRMVATGFNLNEMTVFVVVGRTAADNHAFLSASSGEAWRVYAVGQDARFYTPTSYFPVLSALPVGTHVVAARRDADANESRLYVTGATAATGTRTVGDSDGVTVGALNDGGLPLAGLVYRVVGFAQSLSTEDMDSVASQLEAAYLSGGGGGVERPESLSYPVATPPDPLGSTTALIGAGAVGVRFEVTEAVRAWSVRAYFPNSGYTISEMRIEDSAGTVLATTGSLTGVETIATTWVERDLTSYVELEPGVEYRVLAAIGEQYQHYYSATSPFSAPFTMLGGFRAGSTYADGLGWVDLGYELVNSGGGVEPQALIQYGSVSVSSLAAAGKTYGSRFTVGAESLQSYGADIAIGTNHPVRVQLWAATGQVLLADVEATGEATTWVRVTWPEPIQLNANEEYRCVVAGTIDNWRYAQGVDPVVDSRITFHGWTQGLNWAYPAATGAGHFGLAIPTTGAPASASGFADLSGTYVEEIPFPTGFTTVYGLTMVGSSVWLAALGSGEANHHLQVDPADGSLITGYPSPTGGARAICEGENDTFWSKPYSGDTTRINPADGTELQRVSFAGTTNRGLAWRPEVDPDRIWYGYTVNTIAAFDLATGSLVEEYTIPFSGLFDNYQDFAWEQATGTWWFLDPAGGGEDYLHQIDPDTGTVLQTIQIDAAAAGTATSFLAMALVNGRLWLANSNNDFITVIE